MIWTNEYLLLKDDTILPWSILVYILEWLNLLDLLQIEISSIGDNFDLELIALRSCVVRGHSLNHDRIAFPSVRLQDHVLDLDIIEDLLSFSLGCVPLAGLALVH